MTYSAVTNRSVVSFHGCAHRFLFTGTPQSSDTVLQIVLFWHDQKESDTVIMISIFGCSMLGSNLLHSTCAAFFWWQFCISPLNVGDVASICWITLLELSLSSGTSALVRWIFPSPLDSNLSAVYSTLILVSQGEVTVQSEELHTCLPLYARLFLQNHASSFLTGIIADDIESTVRTLQTTNQLKHLFVWSWLRSILHNIQHASLRFFQLKIGMLGRCLKKPRCCALR